MTFRRSVILLAVTGEEEGLQGSRYFAARPTVPIDSIVADINVDMFLPLGPLHRVIVYGNHESDLGDAFAPWRIAPTSTCRTTPSPTAACSPAATSTASSAAAFPSVMVDFGWEPGTPSEQHHKDWIAKHYHDPTDDTSQHVNLEAAAAFNHLLFDFTRQVANADARPHWKRGSYFRRYADTTRVAQR
jgi:Zn-dependent M28 family amino/carboxypeptidase